MSATSLAQALYEPTEELTDTMSKAVTKAKCIGLVNVAKSTAVRGNEIWYRYSIFVSSIARLFEELLFSTGPSKGTLLGLLAHRLQCMCFEWIITLATEDEVDWKVKQSCRGLQRAIEGICCDHVIYKQTL